MMTNDYRKGQDLVFQEMEEMEQLQEQAKREDQKKRKKAMAEANKKIARVLAKLHTPPEKCASIIEALNKGVLSECSEDEDSAQVPFR